MKHLWIKNENDRPLEVHFRVSLPSSATSLCLSAAPFYQVFLDGRFFAWGPERTAAHDSRVRTILLPKGTKELDVLVIAHGVPSYDCDFQEPFFGAEVYAGDALLLDASSFHAFRSSRKDLPTTKYTLQRGFIERFTYVAYHEWECDTEEVPSPHLLPEVGDPCHYDTVFPLLTEQGEFHGFEEVAVPPFASMPLLAPYCHYDVQKEFIDRVKNGYQYEEYRLPRIVTGLLAFQVDCEQESECYAVFDEAKVNGRWKYGRSSGNDLITMRCPKGHTEILTAVPYTLRFLRILHLPGVTVKPHVILIENDRVKQIPPTGEAKLDRILEAAKHTFAQNAVDLYTDCPGRERAGWLCDSYFTAKSERFFLHSSAIEHSFLENFLLADTPEIDEGMLPMCFPSEHADHNYIPNWAMWYVLELEEYVKATKDETLLRQAKPKMYALWRFFQKYEEEHGLLENLPHWIFVEWSMANDPSYVQGVNFPSNMLYARMLDAIGNLYGDGRAKEAAKHVREEVQRLAYHDGYYCDNALRDAKGHLSPCLDHISETCQYYALFLGMPYEESFSKRVKENLGPHRKPGYEKIAPSNAFIGFFLRLWWLESEKEYAMVLDESVAYFEAMAQESGTLWEHAAPSASMCHGFASSVAPLLYEAYFALKTLNDKVNATESH